MKFSSFLFLLSFCFGLTISSFGQVLSPDSLNPSQGYLNVSSNYAELFVIIDRDFSKITKVNSEDLLELEPGDKTITLVPEFSPPFTFTRNIKPDTVHVIRISYNNILDERPFLYKKIALESQDLENYDWKKERAERFPGSYSISETSITKFLQQRNEEKNFEDTFLKVKANVDSIYVGINAEVFHIASGDSLPMLPGDRFIRLSHQNAYESNRTIWLEKGETTIINKTFDLKETSIGLLKNNIATTPYYKSNFIIVTDKDSRIIIDGEFRGVGAAKAFRRTGPVNVEIINPSTGTFSSTYKIRNQSLSKAIVVDGYTKPKYSKVKFYSLIPGFGQIYKHDEMKAAAIGGSFALFAGLSIYSQTLYGNELDEFKNIRFDYRNAIDEQTALELGNDLEKQHKKVTKKNNQRIVFFSLTSLIYAFNVYDALFSEPKSGYWEQTDINFYLNQENISGKQVSTLSVKYAF